MIVLHSRDHEGVGMTHKRNHPKTSLNFPDNNEVVFVRKNLVQTSFQIDPKHFQQVATEFFQPLQSQ